MNQWQKTRWRVLLGMLIAILPMSWASFGFAQTDADYIPDKLKVEKTAKKDGWFPKLKAGLNFSFAQSDGVVGVPDGTTLSLGLQVQGSLLFAHGGHEWRSSINVVHTQTKLPNLKPFLKAADALDLETLYLYRFKGLPWLGLFAGLKMNTALLDGFLVREENTEIRVLDRTGAEVRRAQALAQIPFQLTKPFAPLLFKQSVGVAFNPYRQPFLDVDIKVGGGAGQAWVQGGLRAADDAATATTFEVSQLFDYVQAGLEFQIVLTGTLFNKILTYSLLGEVMLPLVTSVDTGKSPVDLLNVKGVLQLQIKVAKWLSINYNLSLIRAPLIQPDLQVINNLVLSFTINIL